MSRPYRSWPSLVLRLFVTAGSAEAYFELIDRATEEANHAVREASDDITGPWPCAMPRGLH